ncbi:MAG: sugar ABC transporter substrate-binding protein [Tissierellia bacterium]|nr:sugar ABC transporter substrate-binding protein [Tissierellia bacterium]
MKTKTRWLLAIILVGVLTLTACSKDQEEASTGDGESMNATITVQYEQDWKDHYEKAKERVLEKYPEADIQLVEVDSFENLETIDSTSSTNEDVPDVFALPLDRFTGLAENDALGAIDGEKMAEELGGFGNLDDSIAHQLMLDDDYLAFPYNIETLILYINTKNAEEQNVDTTKAMEINELDYDNALVKIWDAWFGVGALNATDIELLEQNDDGFASDMTAQWNELAPEKQETISELYNYGKKHIENNTSLFDKDASGGYIEEQMATGNAGVVTLDGPWASGSYAKLTNDGEDLEIQPIGNLTIGGKSFKHWKGGWALGVNSRNEEDENKMTLAQEMIKEIVNPEYAADLFESTGKILENVSAEDYENSELSDFNKEVIKATKESYDEAVDRPLFKEWGQVWETWENAILSWSSTKPASDEQAYEQIKASFDAMMSNIGQ